MTQVELSRTMRVDTIGAEPRPMHIVASDAERAALARRFGLVSMDRLEADVGVSRSGGDIVAAGSLSATLVQSCVATAEPVPASVAEDFQIVFRPQPQVGDPDVEVELGEGELDVMFYDSAMVDVGEAVAQSLALALDPYPRAPEAADTLKQAGVKDEGEAGPLGALAAALKDKLGK